ncbi:ATP-binding protein, partial [Flavobacterium sp.]|uniref:sensor histidine kinase n=1 Tax=Flavobacterium sp. TaxID=239 RepID=UPI00344BF16C|nr:ATP-binding protein [Flavobacterium sp.]
KYAKLAYQQAIKLNSSDDRKLCLKLLIELSNDSDIKKYSVQYITLTDSLIRARQIAKNQFAKIKYDSKKEKDENLILKTERAEKDLLFEKQKNNNLLLFALLIIGLLTFLIIFYFIKQKNKKDKIQTSYNTETRISKKLHDELANDLFQTMSFAETQDLSSATNKEILLDNLDTIYSRTRNISMENSPIDTGIYYVTNLKSLIKDFNTNAVNIIVNGFDLIDWSSIPAIQKIVMHRVIQELLVNMKKHSQCTVAVLTFKTESNTIFIRYSDNGIGANLVKSTTHLGIQNMQNRVQSINGKISFDNKTGKGFKVTIELPI